MAVPAAGWITKEYDQSKHFRITCFNNGKHSDLPQDINGDLHIVKKNIKNGYLP